MESQHGARALVTGATGFIGRHLVAHLIEKGREVRCLVRASSDSAPLEKLGARLVLGDMGRPETLPPAVADVDVVYHLASLLKVPWKREFFSANVEGTGHVAAACAERESPPSLVVVSSLAAAGPSPLDRPRTELDPAQPVSTYGQVKLAAERAALAFRGRVAISVVRPPMVFGEGDHSALALYRSTRKGWHMVPTRATNHLAMIHAADLAEALIRVGEAGERVPAEGTVAPGTGLYYAADAALPSYAELGRMVARAQGLEKLRVLHLPGAVTWTAAFLSQSLARLRDRPTILNLDKAREASAGSWICDATKIRTGLGFAPQASLEDRLAQTGRWYRAQGWLEG